MDNLIGSSIIAILQNLIASFLAVVFGIGFTQLVRSRWDEHLYGGWHVMIRDSINRQFIVDLDKNPPRKGSGGQTTL